MFLHDLLCCPHISQGFPCSLPKATSATNSSSPRGGSSSSAGVAPLRHTEDFRKDPCSHITEHPQIDGAGAWRLPVEATVNAINPGWSWKEGMEREPSSCRCQDRGSPNAPRNPGTERLKSFQITWGFIVQYTLNSFAGWNHTFPHGPPGLQEGK